MSIKKAAASGLHDVSWSATSQLLALIVAVGTQIVLAWTLGVEGRGEYAVALAYATLVAALCAGGVAMASVYAVSSGVLAMQRVFSALLSISVAGSVVGVIAGLALLRLPLGLFQKAPSGAFFAAVLLIPGHVCFQNLHQLLIGLKQYRTQAAVLLVQSILLLAATAVAAPIWGVVGALLAQSITWLVSAAVLLVYYLRRYRVHVGFGSIADLRFLLSYGSRFFVGKLASMVNAQAGTLILAFYATRAEIGVFSLAMAICARVAIIPDSLVAALIPRASSDAAEGRPKLVAQGVRISLLLSVLVLGTIAALADLVIPVVFSSEFAAAGGVVRILAVGLAVRFGSKVLVPYFLGTNRPGVNSGAVGLGLLSTIMLMVLWLPPFGIAGAAWASTCGYIVSSIALTVAFRQYSGMTLRDLFRFGRSDWAPVMSLVDRFFPKVRQA